MRTNRHLFLGYLLYTVSHSVLVFVPSPFPIPAETYCNGKREWCQRNGRHYLFCEKPDATLSPDEISPLLGIGSRIISRVCGAPRLSILGSNSSAARPVLVDLYAHPFLLAGRVKIHGEDLERPLPSLDMPTGRVGAFSCDAAYIREREPSLAEAESLQLRRLPQLRQ